MISTTRAGSFIKQFGGPGENTIVCFKFWQAVVASGCPGECAYCFLQTQRPYITRMYDLKGTLFENLQDIEGEARQWLLRQKTPAGLIIGENQDGLAFEGPYKKLLGVTPLEILIPLFANENPNGHVLIILSKFTSTDYAEKVGKSDNVIYSWSLSLPTISETYEKKVASLEARLKKAQAMRSAGHRVRFRLDAMAPIDNWEEELEYVMGWINEVGPEMLTIGALRATNTSTLRRAAENNKRDSSIFNHLSGIDPSGFKHRTANDFHTRVFSLVQELLDPKITLGLCKEDASIWKEVDVRWQGCHCLHGANDAITKDRVGVLGDSAKIVNVGRTLPVLASAVS